MQERNEITLAVRDLEFTYPGSFRLAIDELQLHAASILGLLGSNGSGKTTLLRLLGLSMRPLSGEILLSAQPVQYGRRGLGQRRQVATVFQKPMLLDATVRANVEAGLRFRGMRRKERRRLAEEWLDRFGILRLAHRSARLLSGGETRRVALARALVLKPKLLLLDEPFNDLDREIRQQLQVQLQQILDGTDTAVVLVTHDLYEGLGLVERLGVLVDGRLVQLGSVRDVLDRPINAEVASLVGMNNVWPGRVVGSDASGSQIELPGRVVLPSATPNEPGRRVLVGVRPERIGLVRDLSDPPRGVVVAGTVESIEPAPPLVRVCVRLTGDNNNHGGDAPNVALLDLAEHLGQIHHGECVGVAIAPKDVHVLEGS